MKIDAQGWLDVARRVESPNCNDRQEPHDISLLVVHGISLPPGEFGGPWIDQLFTNSLEIDAHPYFAELEGMEVSAHLLIRRDGELVQYVPFDKRAWHAGQSCFEGREACNDYSIGVELEGCDDVPYTPVQYERLNQVVTVLRTRYPAITATRVVGHSDVAPGRKTDPGPAFDWAMLELDADTRLA